MHKSVEEFSVKTLEVGGLGGALRALRLPFGKGCRSEVRCKAGTLQPMKYEEENGVVYDMISQDAMVLAHPDDIKLLSTLVKRGPEHSKVLRGVMVWAWINAPRYFWQEMATYRIGCECMSSESTMHVEGKGLDEDALVEMKEHLEEGHMQKRILMFSYQTLRRIYFQRKDHRLPQWRKFCDWIKTLPFADEFITIE